MLNQDPSNALRWLRESYMVHDLSPVFDFEFVYLTIMEFCGPGVACPERIEWACEEDGGASANQASCQRRYGHAGEHIALKISQGGDSTKMDTWQIYKRWK